MFGLGAAFSRIKYPSKYIYNSLGKKYSPNYANLMESIDALTEGGIVYLPIGKIDVEDTIGISKPIIIIGSGAVLQDSVGGTVLSSTEDLATKPLIEIAEGALVQFGGIRDLTIYNDYGQEGIMLKSVADYNIEHVFINHGDTGIMVDGATLAMWNIKVKDCWFENIVYGGITVDCKSKSFNRISVLNNVFYNNDLDVKIQRSTGTGEVQTVLIDGNMHFTTGKVAVMLWKSVKKANILNGIYRESSADSANVSSCIRVGDGDVEADKCEYVNIKGNMVDGLSKAKWGVSLEGYTDRPLVMGNTVFGCVTAPYNAGANCTNIIHEHNQEVA